MGAPPNTPRVGAQGQKGGAVGGGVVEMGMGWVWGGGEVGVLGWVPGGV